jgi:Zn-dependent peptidase ImmA (M78 family)
MKLPNLAYRLKMARQAAEAYLRDNGHETLPIDPFAIAAKHDIEVKAKPDTAGGVSGMLLRHGDNFGIVYATHTGSEGFERFSVGHELGHYFLDGHIDHVLPKNGIHTSYGGFVSADPYELEADHYSAGLLMPGALFAKAVNKCKPGLETVEFMAGLCKTSLTATAIRLRSTEQRRNCRDH